VSDAFTLALKFRILVEQLGGEVTEKCYVPRWQG
jgi:hypothetical protein